MESLIHLGGERYEVIGNARILTRGARQARSGSDFSFAARGIRGAGQVQNAGLQTRVLAHLIRLRDQTHVWVTRLDRTIVDPLDVESEVAERVGREFSERVVEDWSGPRLGEFASH